jgi:dipeptidyl aminopeptidase/acylaminoacyl peptidase
MGRLWPVVALALLVCSVHVRTPAQTSPLAPGVTRDDYARAEMMDRKSLAAKLKNGFVVPHWISQSDKFWYRRATPTGYEFVVVDAATGRKQPAFDQSALAQALSQASAAKFEPDKLPFDGFSFNDARDAIHVEVNEKEYGCQLKPAKCVVAPPKPETEGVATSPDTHWGVLTRHGDLWLRDLQSGQERALTQDGEPNFGYGIYTGGWKAASIPRERQMEVAGRRLPPMESYWSPDSRTFIVTRVDQRHVADYPYVETVPGDGGFRPKLHLVRVPLVGEKPPTVEWYACDIPNGAHRRLEFPYDKLLVAQQDMLAIRKTWWSQDNRHLYAVAFGDNMESAYFFDADVSTGKVRTVIEEQMLPRMDLNSTSYNPPNVRITRDGKEVIWFSQRDGWGHLYLYDAASGRLKNQITRGNWLVRDIVDVDDSGRRIYFTAGGREEGNPYYRYLYRVNFDGSGLTLLSPEHADHMLTSPYNDVLAIDGAQGYQVVSPSKKYVIYNYSTPAQPTESVIRTTEDGRLIATFEKADASALFAAGYHPPEEFVAKAADGKTDLWCVLYKPSNFDPQKHYPIIDAEYASPLTAVVPRNFVMGTVGPSNPSAPSAYAELGFIVVVIDARGTTFRSREFLHATYGKLNVNGLDDHVAVIKQLGEEYPWVDALRVGVTGRSYGGWSAFRAMLEFPDFYKVGVAGAPAGSMHNQYLDYHWTAFQGRPIYSNGTELRPTPSEVPRNFVASDGRQQAGRLKGHLLIIMGELDENVVPGSTLQFVDALMKANQDFDLIYLPNTNHYFTGNPYVTRRVWDYFVSYLLGAIPPQYQVEANETPPE